MFKRWQSLLQGKIITTNLHGRNLAIYLYRTHWPISFKFVTNLFGKGNEKLKIINILIFRTQTLCFSTSRDVYYIPQNQPYAAKLRTSMDIKQENGKNIMTSHETSDRDIAAKLLIISFIWKNNFVFLFKYCILLIIRCTNSNNVYD